MLASVRAGFAAALVAFVSFAAFAADKPFQRADLADSAVRLEAQIKTEAGQVGKPVATLRREADVQFEKRDFRAGMQTLAQIVSVAPRESGNWLRLSRTILQIRPTDDRERLGFLERAATAAYIAYQRAANPAEEADALSVLGRTFSERKLWRPALDTMRLALDLRETAEVRQAYEQVRDEHGFRILDYTVDADASSPRACFQFSESLPGKRTDFSPFVAVEGQGKPAISSEEKQLCVEGLKHGERYSVTLRAGLPSTVKETLQRSADYSIYVRDRSPFVRFSGKAYVLPRTGQRGIPVVSVNTPTVGVKIYRVGDRNLVETVLGNDFQRNIYRSDVETLASEKGAEVWKGELKIDPVLNTDVTTAFPIDQAVGDLKPGVYVMTAEPVNGRSESYGQLATQWFIVSDLGLTAFSGNDGINVFLHSLATTEAKAGVEVRLMARNNEVLATRTTDAAGFVRFEAGLARGEGGLSPAMLIADAKTDYAFLNLKAPAFDLSDRGVTGRVTVAGPDAFVYAERGVYRTGETVHLTAMLRDAQGVAVTGVPLTLVVERPDGVEYRRTVLQDQGLGGRSLSMPIISAAPTGTYRVRAYTDPKAPAIGTATFLVEDYVPDRLEFDLAAPTARISKTAPAEVTVDGRFLYGAPAASLDLEGEVKIAPAAGRPGFAGYTFGASDDEEVKTTQQPLEDLPQTDEKGKAKFTVTLDKLPETTRPLEANVTVRLVESGGRAVERQISIPIVPNAAMIGIKPQFTGRSLGEGETAGFDVIVVSPDGKQIAGSGLRYELLKVERRYQYFRRDGNWEYEPVKTTRRMSDGRVDVAADKPGRIALPVSYGRYRLDIASDDASIPATSITFDAGFYAEASADTPDLLEIALDKPEYRAGETMSVAVTARSAGKITVNVIGEKLLATQTLDVQAGTARIPLNVGKDWGTGAYVVATLRRPLDELASRMPGRAIGVQWFAVDRKAKTLALDMKLPDMMRPNGTLRVPVKVTGMAAGEEARIVVAAVDVGILNLTRYKPPAPDDYYLGQRKLSAELRDLYGQLLDGMQGARGTIKTGGDGPGASLAGTPPSQAPLALYSGLVTVKSDGTAEVLFEIPAFAGTVRVMAAAWSKDKVGKATGDVIVRDPVVLTATLPRFLLTGDRGTVRLDLDNVEGATGDYSIVVRTEGPFAVAQGAPQTVRLNAKQRGNVSLPINVSGVGIGTVTVQISGPNSFATQRSYTLAAKPATQVITRRTVRPIAKGESLSLTGDLLADLVPGSGNVQLSVGASTALDVASLLKSLDRYPFGCSEQTVSRALPLLYVNELATESQLALDTAIDQRIRDAIERVLARQGGNGSFGLWGPGGEDLWLDAYVTDFLTRAREKGFTVPDVAFKLAVERLRNAVSAADPARKVSADLPYAYYVLARNGSAPLGDLRYLADTKLDALDTPIAKAQVAAALGLLGDRVRAERVYNAALSDITPPPKLDVGRTDYGSALRDASAFVALASEGNAPRPAIFKAVERIEQARALTPYTSTQENAWMVLAARALARDTAGMALNVNGEAKRGPLYRSFRPAELSGAAVKVTNNGDNAVQAVISVIGAPVTPEPAADKGFSIERLYYTLDGERAEISKVKQNERFAVVLKITEGTPVFGRIIVADYLPAGFEIDNPRLVSSGDTGTLSWIEDGQEPTHTEFRDDRFTAAFDRNARSKAVFTVAYVVRAVSPGKYTVPQAYVEDMYRPDRMGRTGVGTMEVEAVR